MRDEIDAWQSPGLRAIGTLTHLMARNPGYDPKTKRE